MGGFIWAQCGACCKIGWGAVLWNVMWCDWQWWVKCDVMGWGAVCGVECSVM